MVNFGRANFGEQSNVTVLEAEMSTCRAFSTIEEVTSGVQSCLVTELRA